MPLSKYDRHFGGKKGAAAKAMASMKSQYGDRGEQVFYATLNRRRRRRSRGNGLRQAVAEARDGARRKGRMG